MTPEWAAVPAHITQRLAVDAIGGFLRSNSAPSDAAGYVWHWVAARTDQGDVTRCRVKLPEPPLIRKLKGIGIGGMILKIVQSHLYIEPNWELRGGAVSASGIGVRLQMIARVGWSEEHRIAVLFFANGGTLPSLEPSRLVV